MPQYGLYRLYYCLFTLAKTINLALQTIYTSCFLSTTIAPSLIIIYLCIPFLLRKQRYIIFSISFATIVLAFSQFNNWFFQSFIDYLFPEYYFISYYTYQQLIIVFGFALLLISLLRISEDWFYFNKNENNLLKLKNNQIQTKLNSLRTQINPHFLFNSLNVIYSLSLEDNKKTSESIVQLSDILRYVIYDCDTDTVSLKE